jgi:hypothetical protein
MKRCVVMMQQPVLLSPKFEVELSYIFSSRRESYSSMRN